MVADKVIKTISRYEFIGLILILIVAGFLRLFQIGDYMTFLGDEGRDMLVVRRMIVDHKFTLLGPTASVGGFFLGPIYYYFITPFLWAFNFNPTGPAVMVALFGIATVYLVYLTGKKFFDNKTGIMAALLYAISPLVISYSRASWNPNLMPFFSLLTIFVLWQTVRQNRPALLFVVGLLFGILFQLHYLASFLLIISLVYAFLYIKPTANLKYYLFGLFGFLLTLSPFLLFEIRHSFPNTQALVQFLLQGQETGFVAESFFPIIADVFYRLFSRTIAYQSLVLTIIVLLLTIPNFFNQWLKKGLTKDHTLTLLGLWLLIGIFLFGFYQKGIYDYYFAFLFPLPFLLFGFALSRLLTFGKFIKVFVFFLLTALIYLNLRGAPFWFEPNRQMANTRMVANFILEKAEGKPYNFALITGGNSDHAYRYFLETGGNPPVVIDNPQIDPDRHSVTGQLFVICESLPCQPEGHSLWEIAGFGRAQIVESWDIYVVKVYKLIAWHEQ